MPHGFRASRSPSRRRFVGGTLLATGLGCALVLAATAGCERRVVDPGRGVLLILLDAARPDRMGVYGYEQETTPSIDALAARGLVFERCYAPVTATRPSLPALFYSRYMTKSLFPSSAAVPFDAPIELFRRRDDASISLPRALAAGGFRTAAISAHSWLREGTDFAREFDELQDLSSRPRGGGGRRYRHPSAAEVVDAGLDWIDRHAGDDWFLYLHFMDTHFPHDFGEEARALFGRDEYEPVALDSRGRPLDESQPLQGDDRRYLDALYDGGILRVDGEIGRLVEELEARGLLEHTAIAITADHGEHLLEVPGRMDHGGPWYDAVARVPFVLVDVGRVSPGREAAFCGLVDVAPTLLARAGVELPAGKASDGIDLVGVAQGRLPAPKWAFGRSAARDDRYKAIFQVRRERLFADPLPRARDLEGKLYDLELDPLEERDLWSREPERAQALLDAYHAYMLPKHRRDLESYANEPPPTPFAIASGWFESAVPIATLPPEPDARDVNETPSESGWLRWSSWDRGWVLGRPGADPLEVRFPLPDGVYEVSVHARGRGSVEIDGARVAIEAPAWSPGEPARTEPIALGRVETRDRVFRARLRPDPDGRGILVTMLGFAPVAGDETPGGAPADDPDLVERLRALGYVE